MTQKEQANIALSCVEENMNYETLRYSDYLYDYEKEHTEEEFDELLDSIWNLIEEIYDYGRIAFRKKYGL